MSHDKNNAHQRHRFAHLIDLSLDSLLGAVREFVQSGQFLLRRSRIRRALAELVTELDARHDVPHRYLLVHVGNGVEEREVRLDHESGRVELLAAHVGERYVADKTRLCGVDLIEEVLDLGFHNVLDHCGESGEEMNEVRNLLFHLDDHPDTLHENLLDLVLYIWVNRYYEIHRERKDVPAWLG